MNADDTDVIFAKPQELGSKNLYAYCDNNPVVREDYAGEFPIPCIVGAVVGAAVSGFSYVLTSGGEIDGVELAKSCLVGAISGALAPLEPVRSIKKGYLAVASVINGINTAINTDGDIPTRIVCGIIEGGATMASGYICNKWTGDVELTTKTSQVIANAGVGYVVGHVAEIAAVGTSAVAKPITKAIVKNVDSVISNVRTPKQSNTRVITTVSGRKKLSIK